MKKIILFTLSILLLNSCSSTKNNQTVHGGTVELTNANFKPTILENKNVSVVYFWAVWCGPCRMTGPILKEMAKTEIGNTIYGKVNVDNNPLIAQKYGIRSIPTTLIIKDGKVVDKYVGVFSKELLGGKIRAQN